MSIILALLVLFLSLHSCNARVLGVAHNDHAKEFQHSITNQQENDDGGGRHVLIENSVGDAERGKNSSVNVAVRDSSVSKKSWKVPHKKKGDHDEEAGFNLDYLPPKTHPPSHN